MTPQYKDHLTPWEPDKFVVYGDMQDSGAKIAAYVSNKESKYMQSLINTAMHMFIKGEL